MSLLKDGTHNPPKRIENGIPLITGQTLENGFINYAKMTYISDDDYKKIHSRYQPEEKDLIITKIGTVGKVAILRNCDIPIAIHCNSALLRFKPEILSQEMGFWLLQSKLFKEEFNRRISKTVQDFVSLSQLADISIFIPKRNIIEKYNSLFCKYLNIKSHLDFENKKLTQLRDTLLPKLMSGEIDVSKVKINEILDDSLTDKLSFSVYLLHLHWNLNSPNWCYYQSGGQCYKDKILSISIK